MAHSGNANDGETFKNLVKSHISSLKAAQHCLYLIGDSALYTAESIQTLNEQRQYFITRVPQKIIEAKELLSHLDTLAFHDLTNEYRGAWADSDYAGIKQRWLVVHSQHANHRELKTLHKRIEKSITASEKSFKKLCAQTFSCEADTLQALKQWEKEQDYAILKELSIVQQMKYEGRGRPALDAAGTVMYQIQGGLMRCPTRRANAYLKIE